MPLAVERILKTYCDIQRPTLAQGSIGGTKYDWDRPETVVSQCRFSIQSMRPTEIANWQQRGVSVSHKAYTDQAIAGMVLIGDRIKDTRYSPARFYEVVFVEDMAGTNQMFGIFANLIQ